MDILTHLELDNRNALLIILNFVVMPKLTKRAIRYGQTGHNYRKASFFL